MQVIAVTEAITTIAEADNKFGLSRSESADFFPEWHHQLSEIKASDRSSLETLYRYPNIA